MECSSDLIPAYALIPLGQINACIDIFKEIRSELIDEIGELEYSESMSWEPDMIPFLEDGSGYNICVRTLPNDESVWVIPKDLESYKINTSIDRFILTAIECYRQGAYYQELDDDVWVWDTDEVLARKIVKKIDPDIEDYFPP
jgi:cell wall assembly regulator SMI1